MGLLDRLFHRSKAPEPPEFQIDPASVPCPHTALVPRWNSVEDMGHDDRVSSYHCDACGANFSVEEGRQLRSGEAERVHEIEDVPAAAESSSPSSDGGQGSA